MCFRFDPAWHMLAEQLDLKTTDICWVINLGGFKTALRMVCSSPHDCLCQDLLQGTLSPSAVYILASVERYIQCCQIKVEAKHIQPSPWLGCLLHLCSRRSHKKGTYKTLLISATAKATFKTPFTSYTTLDRAILLPKKQSAYSTSIAMKTQFQLMTSCKTWNIVLKKAAVTALAPSQ